MEQQFLSLEESDSSTKFGRENKVKDNEDPRN